MKFIIKDKNENLVNLGRKIGYIIQKHSQDKEELSFTRPLERGGYPRFHLYLKKDKENLIFNLHLDQKRPVYKGAHDHAAEYEGKIVENEVERIKKNLQ